MENNNLLTGVVIIKNVFDDFANLSRFLFNNIEWDETIKSRKTASFGIPYNYSGIEYEYKKIPAELSPMVDFIQQNTGVRVNNCLINFYHDNKARMGYHSDDINILEENTGIYIFSFGTPRVIKFKNKLDPSITHEILLERNSYLYMGQDVQKEWLHSVLTGDSVRISVTFRALKNKVIPMTQNQKKRVEEATKQLKDKELFKDAIKRATNTLRNLKNFPKIN